ncbi:MAG: hypothetical protein CME70_06835 [Halobacteriovorax sp.]|nr:hypothetical protein [Halobacteriovorax sp.]
MKLLLLLLINLPQICLAYTINRGTYGEELHWADNTAEIYFNSSNSSLIGQSALSGILSSAQNEFSSQGFSFNSGFVSNGPVFGRNDIYFTSDSSVFTGSSVLGITKVSFEQSTGTIIESDILLNDSIFFTTNTNSGNYIGDVLTHELGHFIGLGHSEVHGSTMFYSLSSGQDTLAGDDKAAVRHLYTTSDSQITGKVIGGSGVGIFGTHVQAISSSTGQVIASAVSESDGSFIISGLSKLETYYLYLKPLSGKANLPSHFGTARSDFCLSEKNYRGTFFQSCRRSEEGRPQGVSTGSSSSINVGNISIGCELSAPVSYMQNKNGGTNSINIVDAFGNTGDAITGYFSESDITLNTPDEFEIDLTNYSVPSGDIYLDIKIVSQSLYSPIRLSLSSITETIEYETNADAYGLRYDSDNSADLDVVGRIKLDSVASNNTFKFSITPEKISDFIVSKPFSEDSFFPGHSDHSDSENFYLLVLSVSKKELGVYSKISEKKYTFQDNTNCVDAPRAISVGENSQTKSSALAELEKRKKQEDPSILSCGTVGTPGGPPSGSAGFMVAFFLGLVLANFSKLSRIL